MLARGLMKTSPDLQPRTCSAAGFQIMGRPSRSRTTMASGNSRMSAPNILVTSSGGSPRASSAVRASGRTEGSLLISGSSCRPDRLRRGRRAEALGETDRVERGVAPCVVVEVREDVAPTSRGRRAAGDPLRIFRLPPLAPGADPFGPPVELVIGVPARVEVLGAVEPYVDEVGGHLLGVRPA